MIKPTSLIFLILSVILVVGGTITCFIANAVAKNDGIQMFSQVENEDGNLVYVCEYDPEDISKIDLIVNNAKIYVKSSADENKIELINFTEGSYSRGISNRSYIIDDNFNISHLFSFDEGGLSFNGLRQYFRNFSFRKKEKIINVYISSDKIASLSISLKRGSINIDDVSLSGDFILSLSNGNIKLNNVYTQSYVKISGDKCTTDIQGGYIKNLNCNIKSGALTAKKITSNNIKAELTNGNISLGLINDLSDYMINAQTKKGKITANGTEYKTAFSQGDDTASSFLKLVTDNGNIILTKDVADTADTADTTEASKSAS